MKKLLVLVIASAVFSQNVFASQIKEGNYRGVTEDGQACALSLSSASNDLRVGMFWNGDGLSFRAKKVELDGNILKVSGSADFGVGKAKIVLANDGTPVSAKMAVSMMVPQLGYDIDCGNLVLEKQ